MDLEGTKTCARMVLQEKGKPSGQQVIYVMGIWFLDHFSISVSDGLHSWTCLASKDIVLDRASQWDLSVQEYIKDANFYLGHQQPGSLYAFVPVGETQMRLSWTLEKNSTKLEGRWKLEKAKDEAKVTREILDFLMESNIKLSEEVILKTLAFSRMKTEVDKCLAQSQRFANEKTRFEEDIYKKFVAVLNTKKAKLRELRDALARSASTVKMEKEDEDDLGDDTENEGDMDELAEEKDLPKPIDWTNSGLAGEIATVKRENSIEDDESGKVLETDHDSPPSKEFVPRKIEIDPDATQPFEDFGSSSKPNNAIGTSTVTVKSEDAADDVAADILRTSTRPSAPRKRRLV